MLLPAGNLFHIDFGYIFGRDPKPMAPPFRFTREMADGMLYNLQRIHMEHTALYHTAYVTTHSVTTVSKYNITHYKECFTACGTACCTLHVSRV
jgi:Phosphatidylinositol 3- and 4-kinase